MWIRVDYIIYCTLTINICCLHALELPENAYYPNFYQNPYRRIKTALNTLKNSPELVKDWPTSDLKLGQVAGVTLDNSGNLVAFHRGPNIWDQRTFNERNVYGGIGDKPISIPTILVYNETGDIVDQWGQNLFYMPHGITIDTKGNTWVTDVALHQVFKFTPTERTKPEIVLGEKFIPGSDDSHFCKPSSVAVLESGEFFVSDGYCNTRIIKFSPEGNKILEWGRSSEGYTTSPYAFNVPHALTLAEERGLVCVADRERGRISCFRTDSGTYVAGFSNWLIGGRLFSVSYSPVHGGRLYLVNGPLSRVPVRGYVIDFTSGRLIQTFAPDGDFHNPHDIVVSRDGATVYVAEIDPYRIYKFVDDTLLNETKFEVTTAAVVTKPTAVVEVEMEAGAGAWSRGGWGGAARGAAAGGGAALLVGLLAAALLRPRHAGRKGGTRRRWEYGNGEFKLRRLLDRRRFTRIHSDDSEDEPAPMLPQPPANA